MWWKWNAWDGKELAHPPWTDFILMLSSYCLERLPGHWGDFTAPQTFMQRRIFFPATFKPAMALLGIQRPFILEFIPAGLQSWIEISLIAWPHTATLRKGSDYSQPLLLSWMACLYGWFCHQAWYYEHSHCYCLTLVNQLKTNCGVPEKYFISCNETGLQSCIWLPDWRDYKEQWFWTWLHFFQGLT